MLELQDDGLHTVWVEDQRTTEFFALTGPAERRVVIGTDMGDQSPASVAWDEVVWRDAETGREAARSAQFAPVNTGTMVEPGYDGRMYFLPADGNIVELNARPSTISSLPATGATAGALFNLSLALLPLGLILLALGWLLRRRGES